MKEIVIVDGARTPMAEYNGPFSDVSALELGAIAAKEALKRSGFSALVASVIATDLVGSSFESSSRIGSIIMSPAILLAAPSPASARLPERRIKQQMNGPPTAARR